MAQGMAPGDVHAGVTSGPEPVIGGGVLFVCVDFPQDAWQGVRSEVAELIAGMDGAVRPRGYSLAVRRADGPEGRVTLREIAGPGVRGVVLRPAGPLEADLVRALEDAGKPFVAIKRWLPGHPVNCVLSDDLSGARLATEYLVRLGHRRIGLVTARAELLMVQDRIAGYQSVLRAAGLEVDPDLVRIAAGFTQREGELAVLALLSQAEPPTAIFVASDTMAIGGYRAAASLQVSVPRELSLVGYDDLPQVAFLNPPLTTVSTSHAEFGRLAGDLLMEAIEHPGRPPRQVVITPTLVPRASAAAPPAGLVPRSRAV